MLDNPLIMCYNEYRKKERQNTIMYQLIITNNNGSVIDGMKADKTTIRILAIYAKNYFPTVKWAAVMNTATGELEEIYCKKRA